MTVMGVKSEEAMVLVFRFLWRGAVVGGSVAEEGRTTGVAFDGVLRLDAVCDVGTLEVIYVLLSCRSFYCNTVRLYVWSREDGEIKKKRRR